MNVLNHIKRNLILWLSIVFICQVGAQPKPSSYKVDLDYYMPVEWQYTLNPDITTPELYLGFPLGSQHVDWSQVTGYMHLLSEQSDRFSIKTYGHTYENRPLFCLTITSPENQQNLEQIRKNHLKVIHGENVAGPVVTCVGSSIHGNEPSGVQGAIVVAYFLAAAQGKDIEKMLKESVILLIPGYNPDGINRFASWVNSNRNLSNTADSQSREFHEAGPGSRYNHYWHDLNRDWLFLEHPEPRFGVEVFHEWLPNVMSDHHEMGANSSFFFSPGDPKRVSDQLPQDNQKMTGVIAKYIQKDFDRLGSKYFTGRGYDDFYIGKGAAYGDVQGSVCLLCEQASSRGHYRQTTDGILTFPFTIRNQSSAQFSIIYAAWKEKELFQKYMLDFYQAQLRQDTNEGIMFSASHSRAITWHFLNMLHQHHIKVYQIAGGLSKKEMRQGQHFFIPFKGNNPALVHSIMDANKSNFSDSIFYDISAWTIPMAYNLKYETINNKKLILQEVTDFSFPKGSLTGNTGTGKYLFETKEFYAPALVFALQRQGAILRVNQGTVYAEVSEDIIKKEAERTGVDVKAFDGIIDTTRYLPLRQPRIAIITVNNHLSATTGTYWFLTDYRFQMEPSLIDSKQLEDIDLTTYNTIIMASSLPESDKNMDKLQKWVENGGILICANNAHHMLKRMGMESLTEKHLKGHPDKQATKGGFPGGILQMNLSHNFPLSWGIPTAEIPVFKMSTTTFKENSDAIYTFAKQPLSGYFAQAYKENIAGTPAVLTATKGKGRIIYFNVSICFRSYFYGSAQLFSNAILYGSLI